MLHLLFIPPGSCLGRYISGNVHGQKKDILKYYRQLPDIKSGMILRDVLAVQKDPPTVRRIQPRKKFYECGFPSPVFPHNCYLFPGVNHEADVLKRIFIFSFVPEMNMLKYQFRTIFQRRNIIELFLLHFFRHVQPKKIVVQIGGKPPEFPDVPNQIFKPCGESCCHACHQYKISCTKLSFHYQINEIEINGQ